MEFVAEYWWLWLIGVIVSAVCLFTGFFKTKGDSPLFMVFAIPFFISGILFTISIILNIISFAAAQFS